MGATLYPAGDWFPAPAATAMPASETE